MGACSTIPSALPSLAPPSWPQPAACQFSGRLAPHYPFTCEALRQEHVFRGILSWAIFGACFFKVLAVGKGPLAFLACMRPVPPPSRLYTTRPAAKISRQRICHPFPPFCSSFTPSSLARPSSCHRALFDKPALDDRCTQTAEDSFSCPSRVNSRRPSHPSQEPQKK